MATGLGISYLSLPAAGKKWTGAGLLGTLQGLLLWPLLPREPWAYAASVAASCAAAAWVCGRAERALGGHDSPRIVLDELVGFWVAAAGLPREAAPLAAAFALFRLFDSWKPWPCRLLERLPGGAGVVADDVAAALLANAASRLILGRWAWS